MNSFSALFSPFSPSPIYLLPLNIVQNNVRKEAAVQDLWPQHPLELTQDLWWYTTSARTKKLDRLLMKPLVKLLYAVCCYMAGVIIFILKIAYFVA